MKACGKHWRDVAKRVPARTDKQCRERYANVLDPDLRLYAEWTPEEDALLLRAIEEHTQPDGKVRCACCIPHEHPNPTGYRLPDGHYGPSCVMPDDCYSAMLGLKQVLLRHHTYCDGRSRDTVLDDEYLNECAMT